MKKIISTLLVCVLLCASIFTLSSCGNMIMGDYDGSIDLGFIEYDIDVKFSMGKVVIETDSDKIYTAKYKIAEDDEGNRTITFTYEEGADEFLAFPDGEALPLVQSTVEGTEYLTIGLYKLKKDK